MKAIAPVLLTDQLRQEKEPVLLVSEINQRFRTVEENLAALATGEKVSTRTLEASTVARNPWNQTTGVINAYDFLDPLWARLRESQLRVSEAMMLQNSVGPKQLQLECVTTEKIYAGAVTADKINVNLLSAISANLGTITAGNMTIDSTGYIRGGATSYNTGIGFWLGYSGGAYKLSVGNPAGDFLRWTGTALELAGAITATSGTIGGWTISSTELSMTNGSYKVGMSSSGTYKFFAGTNGAPEFKVGQDGSLTATNATIVGYIEASTGVVGGWTIGATTLSSSNIALNNTGTIVAGTSDDVVIISAADASYRIWVGNATSGSASFRVTKAGVLTATGATISGSITATSGTIGGWTINSDYLSGSTVGMSPSDYPLFAGATYANRATAPFRVASDGSLTATSGTFSGTVDIGTGNNRTKINTSGLSVGGFSVNYDGYWGTQAILNSVEGYAGMKGVSFSAYLTVVNTNTGRNLDLTSNSITFTGDTNLYRDSANVLKTDDSFVIGAGLTIGTSVSVGTSLSVGTDLTVTGTTTLAGVLVSFGANDSAGAGYRLVRVPNT